MIKETGYSLMRKFFEFSFKNSRLIRPVHVALFSWCIEKNNQLAWIDEFQLPTNEGMQAIGLRDKETFIGAVKDLNEWGAIRIIEESKNRFTARWITLKGCEYRTEIPDAIKTNKVKVASENSVRYTNATPTAIPDAMPTNNKLYKTTKQNKPKNNIPKLKTSDGIYPACMDLYNSFIFDKTGVPSKINSLTGASMKKIIEYLKRAVKDKENLVREVPVAFEFILAHYDKWEPFHKNQLNLNQIESNLINIINSIKNGKSTASKQPQSKYAAQ